MLGPKIKFYKDQKSTLGVVLQALHHPCCFFGVEGVGGNTVFNLSGAAD